MPQTGISGAQVKDNTIQRVDLDTTTVGQAVAAKLVQGSGITLYSTGADSGTGDVTISAGGAASHYYDYDDFIGPLTGAAPTTTKLFALTTNAGAGSVAQSYLGDQGDGRHGIVQLSGGTVAQNWARAFMGGACFLRASTFTFRMIVNPLNAGATAAAQHLIGFSNSPGPIVAATNYYIIFYFIRSFSANWFYQVRSLTNVTVQDTGVAATLNTWFDLKIVASAASVKFYINGVQVGSTVTTNIPIGQYLYPYAAHNSSTDTVASFLLLDWAEIDIDTGIADRFSRSPI